MIQLPTCLKRQCSNYRGLNTNHFEEIDKRHYCVIYPDRIPDDIAFGDTECKDFKEIKETGKTNLQ